MHRNIAAHKTMPSDLRPNIHQQHESTSPCPSNSQSLPLLVLPPPCPSVFLSFRPIVPSSPSSSVALSPCSSGTFLRSLVPPHPLSILPLFPVPLYLRILVLLCPCSSDTLFLRPFVFLSILSPVLSTSLPVSPLARPSDGLVCPSVRPTVLPTPFPSVRSSLCLCFQR